jgi:uncharacterized protein YdcH (DUF465 family)
MSHTPHDLHKEFPDHQDTIRALKQSDAQFAKLVADYERVNDAVFKAESLIQPTEELHEHELKKERMVLKDAIWRRLRQSA